MDQRFPEHYPVGGFLYTVFCNDLVDAFNQSTYQDPNDDEDVLDEGSLDEPDNDEDQN